MPALHLPWGAQYWAGNLEHSYSIIAKYLLNEYINVRMPPKNLQRLPFQPWANFYSFTCILQPARSAFLCCTVTACLMKFPSHPSTSSSPPLRSWVFPPPRSFPVPTAQVFLNLPLGIICLALCHARAPFRPHLSASWYAVTCSGLEGTLCSTSPFVPHPHPSSAQSQPTVSQGRSASHPCQRTFPFDNILSKITSLRCLPLSFRALPRLT